MQKQFGLIGKTLGHSFSKKYFTDFFVQHNIDAQYVNFELQLDALSTFLERTNAVACNVTIPYKEKVLELVAHRDEISEDVGATNCIKKINSEWHATNTDALALIAELQSLNITSSTKALIFGTGGASKAVQYACKHLGIRFILVSRVQGIGTLTYADIDEQVLQKYNLLINTTPLGMHPNINTCVPIPYQYLSAEHIAFDLVYNPEQTLFLVKSKEHGAVVRNGLGMLIKQAELSWAWWNE
jgi:shikimate dehydrogenase